MIQIDEIKIEIKERIFGSKTGAIYKVKEFERSVYVDGEKVYQERMTFDLYKKRKSPLDSFYTWLLIEEERGNRSNITKDRSNSFRLYWSSFLNSINLKLQLFKIKLKNFFFSRKTAKSD